MNVCMGQNIDNNVRCNVTVKMYSVKQGWYPEYLKRVVVEAYVVVLKRGVGV